MGEARHRSLRLRAAPGSLRPLLGCLGALLFGCASPGQPRPPSLHLPQIVTDLTAQRLGDHVHLQWTTPADTTDNLPVPTHMTAIICRQEVARPDARKPCRVVQRFAVTPGVLQADDILPPPLIAGPAGLLAYSIEVLNGEGRSAGRSPETFAASGAAPPTVEDLVAISIRRAVRLEWKAQTSSSGIELDRVDSSSAAAAVQGTRVKDRKRALLPSREASAEVLLSAKEPDQPDRGGTIDRSAMKGVTYSYTAQRVQTVSLDGHTVSVRSMPSAKVTVKVLDTLPPQPPAALAAAPGGGMVPTIDLSWQPGVEADLAGYNVYREELAASGPATGSWHRLNAAIIPAPAFQDATVRAGTSYRYRVTVVDADGNESAPGNEVQESPGTR